MKTPDNPDALARREFTLHELPLTASLLENPGLEKDGEEFLCQRTVENESGSLFYFKLRGLPAYYRILVLDHGGQVCSGQVLGGNHAFLRLDNTSWPQSLETQLDFFIPPVPHTYHPESRVLEIPLTPHPAFQVQEIAERAVNLVRAEQKAAFADFARENQATLVVRHFPQEADTSALEIDKWALADLAALRLALEITLHRG